MKTGCIFSLIRAKPVCESSNLIGRRENWFFDGLYTSVARARVGAAARRARDGRGGPNSTVPSFRARAVCDPVPAAATSMLGDRPIESAGSRANHSIGYHDQPCVHAQGTVHNHAVLSPPCSTTHPPAPPFIAYRIANGWLARPLGAISTPRRPRHDMYRVAPPACLPADEIVA